MKGVKGVNDMLKLSNCFVALHYKFKFVTQKDKDGFGKPLGSFFYICT